MNSNINSDEYNLLAEMLKATYLEMKDMSKKAPNDTLKPLKVTSLNRILQRAKDFFENEPTKDFLDLLDNDEFPSNSDTVLIMSQYVAAFTEYYKKYGGTGGGRSLSIKKIF
ncbi:MAG: hypothetical protein HDR95_05115 [Bacteroides sp.]|nr:hypothetical protein [Bacteroides sp.]